MTNLFQLRRNVFLLTAAQGLSMTAMIMVVTTAALAGNLLAADKGWATLPIGLQFTATMIMTIPASLLMARFGRRPVFMVGAFTQMLGALTCAAAVVLGQFWILCLGGALFGASNGISMYYRFAAADAADETFKSRAISLVLAGGVFAALVGPTLARWGQEFLPLYAFAGTFLVVSCLSVANGLLLTFLTIPPPPRARLDQGRSLGEIARQPTFVVAVLAGMIAYGVMSLLMTATPLAMAACGFAFGDSAFVIQWHALGMFAPAFFTGSLIKRFGTQPIMQAGALLLAASLVVDLSGVALIQFWGGLILLGVGWNFLFVGATTLLTETYRPEEKAKVQAANDFLIFATTAVASFSAGALQNHIGWQGVNIGMAPLLVVAAANLLFLQRYRRRPIAA